MTCPRCNCPCRVVHHEEETTHPYGDREVVEGRVYAVSDCCGAEVEPC